MSLRMAWTWPFSTTSFDNHPLLQSAGIPRKCDSITHIVNHAGCLALHSVSWWNWAFGVLEVWMLSYGDEKNWTAFHCPVAVSFYVCSYLSKKSYLDKLSYFTWAVENWRCCHLKMKWPKFVPNLNCRRYHFFIAIT